MSKTNNKMLNALNMPSNEPLTVREECEKYGIEYSEPHFESVFYSTENGTVMPGAWYYLFDDIKNRRDLQNAINKYNDYLSTPIEDMSLLSFKYWGIYNKLVKLEKKYSIKRYSPEEKSEFIDKYNKEKQNEVKKAKAIEKVAKEEMTLEE
ncbi:MAG TPA: hypothetical protein DCO89_01740 [Clostridiales bacterium]|nr:hypothetical protein [Clostridiales bacterium]